MCQGDEGAQCLDLFDQFRGEMATNDFNALVTANNCPGIAEDAVAAPPTPAELAERAAASFHLPLPTGRRSPSETQSLGGYPFTYVRLWTYYWTDPATWRTFTATAAAGGNYAMVTATPVSLSYVPGNGSDTSICNGPGRAWRSDDGNSAPTDGACAVRYSRITGPGYDHPISSTQTLTWRLTWTGSGNAGGVLTQRTTSTTGELNVLQIQTVNR